MITLCSTQERLEVVPANSEGALSLRQPLHRLFLRGQMDAVLCEDTGSWHIPWAPDKGLQLERLCTHFARYGVSCSLDPACRAIVEELSTARREFALLLDAGLEARGELSEHRRACLRAALSKEFKRQLTDCQLQAVHHLSLIGNGANFSVPGSGKTSIALAYYCLLRSARVLDAVLVIGPASCFEPWEREYELCFGRPPVSVRIAGNPRGRRREIYSVADEYELLLTTYHTTARDVRDTRRVLSRRKYLLVLDESHYVKRPKGGKLAEAVLQLSECAERRVILTGTPMPNGPADLWSQFTFLWHRILPLGKADAFLEEIQRAETRTVLADVRRRVLPLFFRITKRQLGLPPPRYRVVRCDLSRLQARIYRGIAARFLTQVPEDPDDREALREWRRARAIRLLQVAVNPGLLRCQCDEFRLSPMPLGNLALRTLIEGYPKYEIPAKVAKCCELTRTLTNQGKKVVIWSTFVHNLEMLARQLADLCPLVVHGGVPYAVTDEDELSREKIITRFKTDRDCRILIANPAACGESISLHMVCHDAIYLDRSFNCAHYMQSLDRIHRLGLAPDDVVSYYIMESRETIDEIVRQRLSEKMKNMRRVLEASLPGRIAGFWDEDPDGVEDVDLDLVERHIRTAASRQ